MTAYYRTPDNKTHYRESPNGRIYSATKGALWVPSSVEQEMFDNWVNTGELWLTTYAQLPKHLRATETEKREPMNRPLVGPIPPPVEPPQFPTPWSVTGRDIYDANGTLIDEICTAYTTTVDADLAQIIVDSVNAKFAPVTEASTLRRFRDKDGDYWDEVSPGVVQYIDDDPMPLTNAITVWGLKEVTE